MDAPVRAATGDRQRLHPSLRPVMLRCCPRPLVLARVGLFRMKFRFRFLQDLHDLHHPFVAVALLGLVLLGFRLVVREQVVPRQVVIVFRVLEVTAVLLLVVMVLLWMGQ